jgi:hypothetical protein
LTIQPIGPLDIVLVLAEFVAIATLLGNPVRRLLLKSEPWVGNAPEVTWIFSFTTGVAVLALLLLWIGLVPGLIILPTALVLLVGAIAANLVIYRKQIQEWRGFPRQLQKLRSSRGRWFLALLLAILAVQTSPLIGLWVTPGDDAKLYSLITLRIVQAQGLPSNWGIFAGPSWYMEHVHLLVPGFSSEVAFLNLLFGAAIPSTVSILSSLFRSLAPASVYALAWIITRRRIPAMVSMGVYGLVIIEPTFGWFTWGGMAELSSLSVLPVACAATYLFVKSGALSWRTLLWGSILVTGMSMLHPFAYFYYIAFVIAASVILLFRKKIVRGVAVWLPAFLGLGLGAGPFVNALIPELVIAKSYSTSNPSWTPTLNWTMSVPAAISSLQNRFIAVYGQAATVILLIGLVISVGIFKWRKEALAILGLWYLGLFFLHENNPNGLWLVPFPLWYRIDSNRTFGITSLIVSLAIGLMAGFWIPRLPAIRRIPAFSFRNISQSIMKHWKLLVIAGVILLMLVPQEINNVGVMFGARPNSPITAQDITAFNWIQSNIPANATFFTNTADAGTWIPIYADRKVVMPFGVVTNNTLLADYNTAVTAFCINPDNSTGLQFMNMTGATYVYSGPARINGRLGFDPNKIIATDLFVTLYHQDDVWIFRLK